MKTFRQYLAEADTADREELLAWIQRSLKVIRYDNNSFTVEVDCRRDSDGEYEATQSSVMALNKLESTWNYGHKAKIEWVHKDTSKPLIEIRFK